MGVRTTADEHLDAAARGIQEAIKHLAAVVIDQCWGHDDYTEEYTRRFQKSLDTLLSVRKTLNRGDVERGDD